MRVGIYIDGYNLYYGGRGICGRGVDGWRWLDLRAMLEAVIAALPVAVERARRARGAA